MHPRTKRQKEVLDYITRFMDRNGYEPSYQQIARQLGVSSRSGIQRHVAALESQGLIARRRNNGNFGIELSLREGLSESTCVVEMIEIDYGAESSNAVRHVPLSLPKWMIEPLLAEEVFAFRIPDDSLTDRNISEGDILFFETRTYARRGDAVAARTEKGQWHIGLYYQHGSQTEIRPASSSFEAFIFQADQVKVCGVMRGLLRPFPPLDLAD